MSVDDIIEAAAWIRIPPPEGPVEAETYQGRAPGGYVLTIIAFDIEPQGFPPGSLGYDGAVAGPRGIIRLTRKQAERAFKLAKQSG